MKQYSILLIMAIFATGCAVTTTDSNNQSGNQIIFSDAELAEAYEHRLNRKALVLKNLDHISLDQAKFALSKHDLIDFEYNSAVRGYLLTFSEEVEADPIRQALRSICHNCLIEPVFVGERGHLFLSGVVDINIEGDFREYSDEKRSLFMNMLNIQVISSIREGEKNSSLLTIKPRYGVSPFEVVIRARKLKNIIWIKPAYAFKLVRD